ncbi:MAG: hypothetical protein QM757_13350 [Paludibaculum sp.]
MASKNLAVMATYVSLNDAENALNLLRRAGFRGTDHSLLLSINEGTKDLVHVKSSKAPEGAVAGFAAGAFIGAVIAWLLAGGSIHVPYLDPYLAADPILLVLAGMSIGAVIGGLVGAAAGWSSPNTKPGAATAAGGAERSCFPCTATTSSGRIRPSSAAYFPAPTISDACGNPPAISRPPTSPCRAMSNTNQSSKNQ